MEDLFKDFTIIEVAPTEELREQDRFDYWERLTEAEKIGMDAVYQTFNEIMRECHGAEKPYINLTELYIVANHKVWRYCKTNPELAKHYGDMRRSGYEYVTAHFTKEELDYFYRKTD